MSKAAGTPARDTRDEKHSDNLPAPYEVGYGKPPAEHRFRKGQSGNAGGRPKGAKNRVPRGQGLDFGTQPANQMLLEEAYRTVSIREGDKVIELPVIKAVFRSMGVSAMKGNRLAQTTMAELVRGIEEEDRQLRSSYFDTACEYKTGWEQAIEQARRHGLPEPTPVPHPDDVILDIRRAEVRYEGPITLEEKKRWDRMLEFRDEQQEEVSYFANGYRDAKKAKADPDLLEALEGHWKRSVALYDRINDPLPDRYRKRLENRFYHGIIDAEDEK
ncbi:hypothetical protein BSL82_00640 [Tardibacter chloracetimidivorans]|uniref:DUF5681 domain-containing protein n=1 Tax=Tardibacter chloracetimidivorans TaxID=1921510 RepID=A0A1L3ZQT8_9SPHN|nr:DUF5681 domain-containing protein [Tardibacter chloracetimidivorans]API57992.1 hypothetical protein BSL82_00640 [Tardibacter chloracetimidivorans]